MAMADRIEPALTAEEWARIGCAPARVYSDGYGDPDVVVLFSSDGWVTAKSIRADAYRDGALNVKVADRPAAVIALLNAALPDSDPRKITRERLARLHYFVENETTNDPGDDALQFLDALASYLPPETP
jgi:hypothetical protein